MILQDYQKAFLMKAEAAAKLAGHIFPAYAACEAALESGFGRSMLATNYNNLLGSKQHSHPIYGTASLPTREFEKGEWIKTEANWVVYPDWDACFKDRMDTLTRLAPKYPNYAAALAAKDGTTYINAVSATWSTDPKRGASCLAIYDAMTGDWNL